MRPAIGVRLALALLLVAPLAGCASRGQEATDPTPTTVATPNTGPLSRFVVEGITIRPPEGSARQLREDDAHALVRYVVRQPDDAPTETAFVSYAVDGVIVDVQNLRLEPGETKEYERVVEHLRSRAGIRVEVRAGASVAHAEASVAEWPRAGEGLALGPLVVRVDYGLKEQDGQHVLVNVTLQHTGPQLPIEDFRVKMVCADEEGRLSPTTSVETPIPTYGNQSGVDVIVDDCPVLRYGLEFKGDGEDGISYYGRILLVARGWAPPES